MIHVLPEQGFEYRYADVLVIGFEVASEETTLHKTAVCGIGTYESVAILSGRVGSCRSVIMQWLVT